MDESISLAQQRCDDMVVVSRQHDSAMLSLGTLGGGNHFIEVQQGWDGYVWVMLHSGSRNLGLKVAQYYNELAVDLNRKWHSSVDPAYKLAFLPADSSAGRAYIREMRYCIDYAAVNRRLMMDQVQDIFKQEIGEVRFSDTKDVAHNYARLEHHFGRNVWVHRKGATSAREGEVGIIPGSMGTASYITKGRGNEDSFMSCSHGAGRNMSRRRAVKELDLVEEQGKLKSVVHSVTTQSDLDEAPGAYKDIDEVMENQKDLACVLLKLTPLASVKG